jgi:hypothetical protein
MISAAFTEGCGPAGYTLARAGSFEVAPLRALKTSIALTKYF